MLVGYSEDGMHSERSIGYPLLHRKTQAGLKKVFTEREPCQSHPGQGTQSVHAGTEIASWALESSFIPDGNDKVLA
ncbi:hypothetical protein AB0D42_13640 [Streptomyces sp. NPDC048304]|uniref:hypothetical protein n=1 Tax=Streptomyces sp. NPDC048304 TaxID=3154820 RepID=UPI0033CCF02B